MNENLALDSDFTTEQYRAPEELPVNDASPTGASITSLNGLSGPSVTFSGGMTGLSYATAGTTLTLTGTLVAANGGTGQSSYTKGDLLAATGAAALAKLAVGANDARLVADSGAATGLRWQAVSTGWTASTGTATRTAFDTATATATEVAERLKALIDDLMTQKILKA